MQDGDAAAFVAVPRRVDLKDARVMSWYYPVRGARQEQRFSPSTHHVRHIVSDVKRQLLFHVFKEMSGVAHQHDRAAHRLHPDHLHSRRVATHEMRMNAGCDLVVAVKKMNPPIEIAADDRANILGLEDAPQADVPHAHIPRSGESHLSLLQVQCCARQLVQISGVVIVKMSHDHIVNLIRLDAQHGEGVNGAAFPLTAPSVCRGFTETGVYEHCAACRAGDPHVIVHRQGAILRDSSKECVGAAGLQMCVSQGVQLVGFRGHGRSMGRLACRIDIDGLHHLQCGRSGIRDMLNADALGTSTVPQPDSLDQSAQFLQTCICS